MKARGGGLTLMVAGENPRPPALSDSPWTAVGYIFLLFHMKAATRYAHSSWRIPGPRSFLLDRMLQEVK